MCLLRLLVVCYGLVRCAPLMLHMRRGLAAGAGILNSCS
jgi:hypothetical protein